MGKLSLTQQNVTTIEMHNTQRESALQPVHDTECGGIAFKLIVTRGSRISFSGIPFFCTFQWWLIGSTIDILWIIV